MTIGAVGDPRRSIFVGRERELAQLTAALDGAVAGQGTVLAVSGEPGIGKTRLVQELERHANAKGIEVHWGRTPESEAAPYWPWIRAIRSLIAGLDIDQLQPVLRLHADGLLRLFPELSPDGAGLARPAPGGGGDQLRVFDGITSLIVAAARLRPLILVLEDLHWADTSSLALLRYLTPEISRVPLLVVVTYRAEEVGLRPALGETVASLARHAHVQAIELAGLSEAEVGVYLREATGQDVSPRQVSRVVERTQGNPFFLSAVASLQDGALETALPPALKSALEQRLARVSPDCNDLLTVAAVVGQTFGLDVLRELVPGGGDHLLAALDEAFDARLLDESDAPGSYRFHHALVQEALLHRIPVIRRAQLHGHVGEAIERLHGGNPEQAADLAFHFRTAAAVEPGYAERALRHARRAAEHAELQFAWDEAARHHQSCVELADAHPRELEVDMVPLLLAQERCQMASSNPFGAGAAVLRALSLLADRNDPAGIVNALSLVYTYQPPTHLRISLVEAALKGLDAGDVHTRARLLLIAARGGADEQSQNWLAEGKSLVKQHSLRDVEPLIISVEASQRLDAGDVEEYLRLRRREFMLYDGLGMHEPAARALSLYAQMAPGLGRTAEFLPLAEELDAYADRINIESPRFNAFHLRATLRHGRGDISPLPEGGPEERFHSFTQGRAFWATVRGDLEEAVEALEQGPWLPGAEHFRYGNWAWVELECGNREAAREQWQRYRRVLANRGDTIELITHAAFAQRTLMPLFDDELCEQLLGSRWLAPQRMRILPTSLDCARGLVALKLGRLDTAEAQFRVGQAWAEGESFPIEEGRNLQGLADVAEARGDTATALGYLDQAIPLFEGCGAGLYVGHAVEMRERLLAAGAKRSYPAGLTEREVEVLGLLAEGYSNAAIAEALVIAKTTAAAHVRNILGKTGLANRTQAAAFAIVHGLVSDGPQQT